MKHVGNSNLFNKNKQKINASNITNKNTLYKVRTLENMNNTMHRNKIKNFLKT